MNYLVRARRPALSRSFVSILLGGAVLAWVSVGVVAAASNVTLGVGTSPTLGKYLTGPTGHTLYTLSSEPSNGVLCTAACLGFWPPLTVSAGGTVSAPAGVGGTFGTFKRSDNAMIQASENGHALYYFANDTAAGQTNGEGIKAFGGVWHVAKASLAPANPPATDTDQPGTPAGPPVAWLLVVGFATFGLSLFRSTRRSVRRS